MTKKNSTKKSSGGRLKRTSAPASATKSHRRYGCGGKVKTSK